jgi:hypothetical protein
MPIRSRFNPLFIALKALLAIIALNGIASAQDDDVVRVNSELVVLNVTVTDKAGQYVKTLKKPDFKVFEDGVEVDPRSIQVISDQPYAAKLSC